MPTKSAGICATTRLAPIALNPMICGKTRTYLSNPNIPLLFHREKTVERHNPSEPPGATLAHASKRKTINDSGNLAIKYRAPAHLRVFNTRRESS